ncbi:ABC transporter ATP-binding protein [Prauserella cavernicola]|uniref:ABC transporter ATP-binding protein n=1 Tax=Prauserella cavernicola TaxID=2800127 RepID=A0A934QS83_9PSEU|nr:ABC transporter ATP-binding protein [Prauserella cavernicola]MBK1785253.1 ABC transporter ATP-binding protein [Prauserella cavernicola]
MTVPTISTRGVGKRYGRRWGLRDCTLDIEAGRVVGLVGPNGAGKSTLLSLLVGLLRPTEGSVEILGAPAGWGSVAYLDQRHALYESFRVRDMIEAGARLNERWFPEVAFERLQDLGISLEHKVGNLSGGQRAQVALALALAKRPDLLVLDEPVASLDPLARRDLMGTLMEVKSEWDCTVVLSSHVVSELERLCDYLVVLDEGTLRYAGDIDELLDSHGRQRSLEELILSFLDAGELARSEVTA